MTAYYNEFDPKAAAWLRELIKQGHIADGVVDDRSIEDVTPTELAGFTQCHFFAGIGVWSYALRRAGWSDNRPVWTGSCPCQPFSAAGKGAGFDDERHLWPAFHHLISQCRPPIVLGEQVASKDGLGWLDLVQSDLEATGYASGAVDLCAAGIGAPHIRQRLWWVGARLADTAMCGRKSVTDEQAARVRGTLLQQGKFGQQFGDLGATLGNVANADNAGSQGRLSGRPDQGRQDQLGHGGRSGAIGGMANTNGNGCDESLQQVQGGFPERLGGNNIVDGLGDAQGWGEWSGQQRDGRDGGDEGTHRAASDVGGMADTASGGQLGAINDGERGTGMVQAQPSRGSGSGGLADTSGIGRERGQGSEDGREHDGQDAGWQQGHDGAFRDNETGAVGLADTRSQHLRGELGSGDGEAATPEGETRQWERGGDNHSLGGPDVRLADTNDGGHAQLQRESARGLAERGDEERPWSGHEPGISDVRLADTASERQHQRWIRNGGKFQRSTSEAQGQRGQQTDGPVGLDEDVDMAQQHLPSSPTNGHWRDADWLFCRDGKWRPVEPGTSPLAHGAAARVGRLRGYGNAIVAQAAQAFIESVM